MTSRSKGVARGRTPLRAARARFRSSDPEQVFDAFASVVGPRVEETLHAILPDPRRSPRHIHRAMRYMVIPGGKRLRPLMAVLAHRTFGGRHSMIYKASASIELIHTFSLIHDDLPCMDDDDYRRGRFSCHKAFGEATAVLAGDALLVHAFEVLGGITPEGMGAQLVKTVSNALGTQGVLGGQSLDLESEGKRVSQSVLATIHRRKTAALFVACLVMGGLMAKAPRSKLRSLASYGLVFGQAFQVADDLLSVEGGFEELGRPRGRDVVQQKATYPRIVGEERARDLLGRLIRRTMQRGEVFGRRWAPLYRGLALKVARRVPSWRPEREGGIP